VWSTTAICFVFEQRLKIVMRFAVAVGSSKQSHRASSAKACVYVGFAAAHSNTTDPTRVPTEAHGFARVHARVQRPSRKQTRTRMRAKKRDALGSTAHAGAHTKPTHPTACRSA
jgi:hypothetical protein